MSTGGTTLKTPLLEGFFVYSNLQKFSSLINQQLNLISTKTACFNTKVCISFVNGFE